MDPQEWMRSAALSWGVRFDGADAVDTRINLLKRVSIVGDCWQSSAATARVGTKTIPVQVAAFGLFSGPIPNDGSVIVASTCGNPRCVYVGHLKLVSPVKQSKKNVKSTVSA